MVFSSLEFILIFLPIFFLIYYVIPASYKNIWILLSSIVFYYWGTGGNIMHVTLVLELVFLNYLCGLLIEHSKNKFPRSVFLICGILWNAGSLLVFKYSDFVISNTSEFVTWKPLHLLAPLGISFIAFQSISYLADIYIKKTPAEHDFVNAGAYLLMFPRLVSGPITRYADLRQTFRGYKPTWNDCSEGLQKFVLGLSYKVLLANRLGMLFKEVTTIGYESISTPLSWMGIIAYSLQIYFDFYGYSLMAMGLGKMMGFDIPKNFDHPYTAVSLTDFFRRWHITLGRWFRDYVYIPLGGSRKNGFVTAINILFVWALTGLWHGASWNFVLWGMGIAILILIEKAGLIKLWNKVPFLGHLYMLLVIPLSWMVFAIRDLSDVWAYLNRLFPFGENNGTVVFQGDYIKYGRMYGLFLIVGILFATGIQDKLIEKYKDKVIGTIILTVLFWVSVYCIYLGMNDPFLYFSF